MYQDQYGQTECKPCPAGYYSSKSKERCNPCDFGSYSPGNGIDGCITCSSNTECPCLDESTCFNVGNSKALCVNTGGGGNYECSNCPAGFIGDGVSCADLDEVCCFFVVFCCVFLYRMFLFLIHIHKYECRTLIKLCFCFELYILFHYHV